MRYLKLFFLMSILGIAINSYSQKTSKIERSPHLAKNENIFLDKIPVKLLQLSERIYSSGAIDVKQFKGTTEQDLLIALDLNADISFKFRDVKESRLKENAKFKRYIQYYKDIKIEGAGFTAKYENNDLTYFKPIIHQNINLNPLPQISASQLNEILQTNKVFSQELIITDRFQSRYKLFWKVNYMNQGNKISYVDAATGEVVNTSSGIVFKNAPTEDFGVQNMNDTNIGNVTSLRSFDDRVKTFNFNLANLYDIGIGDFSDNLIPTSPSNTIWSINHAPTNVYQAHWAVSNCVNEFDQLGIYFEQVNVGANLDNVYNGNQSPNAAAFYASTLAKAYIAFGHSDVNTMAHNDVIGHELSHVFLSEFLTPEVLSSATLHEGISDMFGVYVESRLQNLDWKIGDDVPIDVRNLQNPEYDCFDDAKNNPVPHLRCTPLGYWFYKLTTGDQANGIQPIPMLTTLNIIMDALPNMPEDSDFPEMREETLVAVGQTYGFCSDIYLTFAAAWDFICVEGEIQYCSCNADSPDIVFTTSTILNDTRQFSGNIIVESGTLHFHQANILMRANKSITVKNGGRLILQGSTIGVCNPEQSWAGIKVEPGGFLDIDDAIILNAANGIEAQTYGTLQIYNLSITGKGTPTGIGLKLDGNVNSEFIYYLDIKDFNTGIQTYNSSNMLEFNHGSILNTSFGISSVSSPIIVNDYNISFTKQAITLNGSPASSIFDTDILYKEQGIAISNSPLTNVENCSISNSDLVNGIEYLNERPAIGIVLSDNCNIINNYTISSASNAVSIWGSNSAVIDNNNIFSNFSSNGQLTGGPVNLQFGNGHSVTQNHIGADQSEFGINSTWSISTQIMNNTIYNSGFQKNFRTAAIKATGNLDEVINQNIVTGDERTGILVQNTTGNQYYCNEINSTYDEAQDILYNSEQQTLKANTYDGGAFDLKLKSEIGKQATYDNNGFVTSNNGNIFFGGNALADQEIVLNSTFPFNPSNLNHKPANPNPSAGWFIPNTVVPYANCEGLNIGDNFIFGNDPNKICAYWNYLKSIKNTKSELFFVKLVHLLKYSKTKSGFTLPNCIKLDSTFQTLCGITKLVDVSVALTKISQSTINTSTIQSLQSQYYSESSDAGKAAIKNQMATEMATLMPQFDNERNTDSLRLDSLKSELSEIDCPTLIVSKWKEILKIYINFLKQGKVSENDKSTLETYSTDCSDLYGEAIHLARSMANTYNRTYYDVYDGCLIESDPRLTFPQNVVEITVAPNPTTGKINLSYSGEFTGTINVYNASGQRVFTQRVTNSHTDIMDISNEQAGLYLMQAVSDQGISKEFKLILIK